MRKVKEREHSSAKKGERCSFGEEDSGWGKEKKGKFWWGGDKPSPSREGKRSSSWDKGTSSCIASWGKKEACWSRKKRGAFERGKISSCLSFKKKEAMKGELYLSPMKSEESNKMHWPVWGKCLRRKAHL